MQASDFTLGKNNVKFVIKNLQDRHISEHVWYPFCELQDLSWFW